MSPEFDPGRALGRTKHVATPTWGYTIPPSRKRALYPAFGGSGISIETRLR